MWRYLLPGAVFLVLCGFFVAGLYRDPTLVPSPLIGKPAPAFSLPKVENIAETVALDDYKGQVFVLNVWGTWCVACRQEHEMLLEIERSGVVPLVGLNWKDDLVQAQAWLAQLGNPYTASAFDEEGRVGIDFGVYGAPETFLVDGNGRVIFKFISPMTREVWEKEFLPRIQAARQGSTS